jgi:hypothetical protein
MKRIAIIFLSATLTIPCAASDPIAHPTIVSKPHPRPNASTVIVGWGVGPAFLVAAPQPKLLDDETVCGALFPLAAYAEQVANRIKWHRQMLENGGQGGPHGPYWPFLD